MQTKSHYSNALANPSFKVCVVKEWLDSSYYFATQGFTLQLLQNEAKPRFAPKVISLSLALQRFKLDSKDSHKNPFVCARRFQWRILS